MPRRLAIAPLAAAAALATGLYLLPWRSISFGSDAIRVSPTAVDLCSATECRDGEPFGIDLEPTLRNIDGDAFATLMHAAHWSVLVAALAQLALGVAALARVRDRWPYRIAATLAAAVALVVTGVIAYGIVVEPGGRTESGLWLAIAGALAGAVAPLIRRRIAS